MARKQVLHEDLEGVERIEDNLSSLIIDDLKKNLGDVAYILGSDESPSEVSDWLSTGSTILDMMISNNPDVPGGIPLGRLTEIYGLEAVGKSLLAYKILKDCQQRGGMPVLIDTENSANLTFLEMLGLDPSKNMIYIQVDTIEEVFTAIERVITKIREEDRNRLCAIVWDSVAATTTKAELQGEYGDSTVGLAARLIGQGLRKIMKFVGKQRIALVFLNQLRMKIGANLFGDPFTTPGGKAIPFFSSVRIQLLSSGKIKGATTNEVLGVGIKAKVTKNRMGPPYREAILNMYFDKGVIDEESWLDILLNKNNAEKISAQKSSVKFNGEVIEFKNKEFVELLESNSELKEYLKKEIKKSLYIDQEKIKKEEDIVVEALSEDESF